MEPQKQSEESEEGSNVHVCTAWDVENDLTTDEPKNNPIEGEKTRVRFVQPTKCNTKKEQLPKKKQFYGRTDKRRVFCKAMTQVDMNGLQFHVRHNGLLFQAWMIDGCLQEVLRVLLKNRNPHAELYSPSAEQQC